MSYNGFGLRQNWICYYVTSKIIKWKFPFACTDWFFIFIFWLDLDPRGRRKPCFLSLSNCLLNLYCPVFTSCSLINNNIKYMKKKELLVRVMYILYPPREGTGGSGGGGVWGGVVDFNPHPVHSLPVKCVKRTAFVHEAYIAVHIVWTVAYHVFRTSVYVGETSTSLEGRTCERNFTKSRSGADCQRNN